MILLMGIAGSGKGTQGKLLAEASGFKVISTGELLRNYGSDEQHARMATGALLRDDEVTELLDKALKDIDDQNKTILDGYPRSIAQAEWLMQADESRFKVSHVIHLLASREAVKSRLMDRARPDDHDDAIEARFNEYEKATLPILDYFQDQGIEVVEINGEQAIEDVHREILECIPV